MSRFFQDCGVKVSLFLQGTKKQNLDGTIVVPCSGVLPRDQLFPGTVRYFQGGVETRSEMVPVVNLGNWEAAPHMGGEMVFILEQRPQPQDIPETKGAKVQLLETVQRCGAGALLKMQGASVAFFS